MAAPRPVVHHPRAGEQVGKCPPRERNGTGRSLTTTTSTARSSTGRHDTTPARGSARDSARANLRVAPQRRASGQVAPRRAPRALFGVRGTPPTARTPPKQAGFVEAPGRTRTCDPRIRNPTLYPAELRRRMDFYLHSVAIMRRRRRRAGPVAARRPPGGKGESPRERVADDRGGGPRQDGLQSRP